MGKVITETERIIRRKLRQLNTGQQKAFRRCSVDVKNGWGVLSGPSEDMRLARLAMKNITAMLTEEERQVICAERPTFLTGHALTFVDLGAVPVAQC